MQALYSAVMALARSAEDARRGGWICQDLGRRDTPKCVNGLVTWNITWPTVYNQHQTDVHLFGGDYWDLSFRLGYGKVKYIYDLKDEEGGEAALLAGQALLKTCPSWGRQLIIDNFEDVEDVEFEAKLNAMFADPDSSTDVGLLGDSLAMINDATDGVGPLLGAADAAAWFDRACDLLAERLPDPLPTALTVDEGIIVNRAPELTAV